MRFFVTQNVRQFDAGIIELGLVYSDRMAIPPGMEKFKLDGYCLPECTATVSKDMKYGNFNDLREKYFISYTLESQNNCCIFYLF
jgi:dopamine beta-monooxygenase